MVEAAGVELGEQVKSSYWKLEVMMDTAMRKY
jgi:hypothetical protein